MRAAGRLGDQHKVARVTNDRTIANALLAESGVASVGSESAWRGEMRRDELAG
jgi:hypothetical protein